MAEINIERVRSIGRAGRPSKYPFGKMRKPRGRKMDSFRVTDLSLRKSVEVAGRQFAKRWAHKYPGMRFECHPSKNGNGGFRCFRVA